MFENEYFKIEIVNGKVTVISKVKNKIEVNFFDYDTAFRLRTRDTFNSINCWVSLKVKETNFIYVVVDEFKYFFYSIKDNKLIDLYNRVEFDFNSPLIFFTGHMGGGTSVVVKLLRHLGIHFGDDCGDIKIRKTHESISMTSMIDYICNNDTTPSFNVREIVNEVISIYNYKPNKINCFKRPFIDKEIDLTLLGEVFPNIKFVSVIRDNKNGKLITTKQGNDFVNADEISLCVSQRPIVEGNPIFHLNFKKFFTDYNYVNKLLRYIGSDNFLYSDNDLNILKDKIGFDERVLS